MTKNPEQEFDVPSLRAQLESSAVTSLGDITSLIKTLIIAHAEGIPKGDNQFSDFLGELQGLSLYQSLLWATLGIKGREATASPYLSRRDSIAWTHALLHLLKKEHPAQEALVDTAFTTLALLSPLVAQLDEEEDPLNTLGFKRRVRNYNQENSLVPQVYHTYQGIACATTACIYQALAALKEHEQIDVEIPRRL